MLEDYLPRLIRSDVIRAFEVERSPNERGKSTNISAYKLYKPELRKDLPMEFAAAAYRYGHSMMRSGYVLQDDQIFPIFDGKMDEFSLVGFQPLVDSHIITHWDRFFVDSSKESDATGQTMHPSPGTAAGVGGKNDAPPDKPGQRRLQWAYRIDTSMVDPLSMLPASVVNNAPSSLAVRNLWRAAQFELASGQDVAKAIGVHQLPPDLLCVRDKLSDNSFRYREVVDEVKEHTPLWFYILAEAQASLVQHFRPKVSFKEEDLIEQATATATQMGPVGGRILLETFHGVLDADLESYRNDAAAVGWKPLLQKMRIWDLLHYTAA